MTDAAYRPGPIEGVSEEVQACFPTSGALHAYVWWATQTTHAPSWWHVATGLTMIAHSAARNGYVLGSDQRMKPSLWVALIGPSAAGKSTAINRAIDFYTDHLDAVKARDPFVMAEGSIPGIFERLTDGWDDEMGRTLGILYQDEFSRLLDRKDTVAEMIMQLVDGRTIERHKVSDRKAAAQGQKTHSTMRNPVLSAMFATTYSSLRRVTHGNHLDGGLYSRLLWFVADPDPSRLQMLPTPRPLHRRAALTEWREWEKWLITLDVNTTERAVEVPEEVYSILHDSLFETARQNLRVDDRLNGTRLRAVIQAYKTAALFAFSQGRLKVISEDMDAAVNLIEKCTAGLERVDPELGNSEIMQLVNVAFRAVQGRGTDGLGRSQLYPVLKSPKAMVEQVISTLLDEGSIREVTIKTPGKRGPAPRRYVACGAQRFTGDDPENVVVSLHGPKGIRDNGGD